MNCFGLGLHPAIHGLSAIRFGATAEVACGETAGQE